MRLSTKTRYGLRALVDLAARPGQGPVLIDAVARRQEISRKYLDAIFGRLREAGLVRSQRGAHGGVTLARDPAGISIAEVVRALDGPILLVDCRSGEAACTRGDRCVTAELWQDLSRRLERAMEEVTVGELATRLLQKEAAGSSMFHI
ncbi:MAG: Rrf2 family transcriptional regulator [Deltaproteobacteria bacterium]|nr:Rrf2 family transcriptional regulator [Deltaproteobacteria bacterium]